MPAGETLPDRICKELFLKLTGLPQIAIKIGYLKGGSMISFLDRKGNPQNNKCVKCVLSIKESNFNGKNGSKFSNLITVRAEGADPPIPLPYGQRDRKYPFSTPSLRNTHRSKSLLKTCFNVYYVKIANLIRKTGNQNY